MKKTFTRISEEKRTRIIESSIEEFAEWGYEKGSLDRIIKKSGISKGGLYEYISSKEELFLFVADHAYNLLYDHIIQSIGEHGQLPADLLERFRLVSSKAIDFYLANPVQVKLIIMTGHIIDEDVSSKVREIFFTRFRGIFGDADRSELAYDYDSLLNLMEWLLLKTRNHFLRIFMSGRGAEEVRREYTAEWDFIVSVLRGGIYKKNKG
ncbi:MAG TPA: TetR/AcrR family transcriptional regulator [Spirochaetota bacterium]|nr:TetR/AcrR family transcriptional regulator [Spirochaetota bacterium]